MSKLKILYLSEETSCPEQEWYSEPHDWKGEPYTPYVPLADYQKAVDALRQIANNLGMTEAAGDNIWTARDTLKELGEL